MCSLPCFLCGGRRTSALKIHRDVARAADREDFLMNFLFFFNSVGLGVGLAMDAFSVSLANGLSEPDMPGKKHAGIAGVFAGFQFLMPMIGWFLVHSLVEIFSVLDSFIPWIALALLGFIGGKMLVEGIHGGEEENVKATGIGALLVQGVATSIDALSVGLTIADYSAAEALVASLIIAVVTFGICTVGLFLGKKFGTKLAGRAGILGGAILIFIGIEIFVRGIFHI